MDIAHRVKYLREPLSSAADHAIENLRQNGGIGGVIALDDLGNGASIMFLCYPTDTPFVVTMPLNSPGMFRGVIREDGVPKTAIFADDVLE